MKKTIFLFIWAIVTSVTLYGQNTFPASGNVGIGTTNPSTTLEVNGNFKVASGGNQLVFNGYADLNLNCPARGSGGRAVVHDFGNTLTLNYAGDFSGGTRLGSQTYFSENPNGTSFVSGGNLGVGTTDTHGYKLAVNGSIHTQEVRVDMNGWPDYVFRPAYRLASLNSVRSYIDHNGHLPEMPSAAEVEKQGVNLGEMNRVLVKKVEELTLYLIEKDKQLDREKQERISEQNHLKAALSRLERKLSGNKTR